MLFPMNNNVCEQNLKQTMHFDGNAIKSTSISNQQFVQTCDEYNDRNGGTKWLDVYDIKYAYVGQCAQKCNNLAFGFDRYHDSA